MKTRTLGRTGLAVSEISLGTVELGLDYGIAAPGERLKPDEQAAGRFLNYALDSGINLIDTARAYGDSERIVGQALHSRRHEFVLLSKVRPGLPANVRQQVQQSLTDLQTEVVDIMMIHSLADQIAPDGETVGELQERQRSGEIRFIGASVYGPAAALAAIECGWFDCIEVSYSLLDRRPEDAVFPAAASANVGVIARSVLLKGALTARCQLLPDSLDDLKAIITKMADIAGSFAVLPEMAYRYVLAAEPPHSVLVGTSSRQELDSCIRYATQGTLPLDQLYAIQAVRIKDERWLNPGNWPGDNFPKPVIAAS